jgi:hypothetical protein
MTSVMMFQHHYGFCTLLALDAVKLNLRISDVVSFQKLYALLV